MTDLNKIVVQWTGLTALPGVSVHYTLATAVNPVGDLNTFFTALRALFPTGLAWILPGAGDIVDAQSGHLTGGTWTSTGSGTVTANGGSTGFAAGTGCKVNWLTGGITPKNRKIKGHTVLAPLLASQFGSTGSLGSTGQTTIQTAANALVAGTKFGILHRNTPGSTNGAYAAITAAVVPAQCISLRSRRY